MRGKAQRDSPVLVQLASSGKHDWMIRELPVRNMVSTPNIMEI